MKHIITNTLTDIIKAFLGVIVILSVLFALAYGIYKETPENNRISFTEYKYNAYSPLYDEYFVISSDRELKAKDVVWFNDNAQAVDYATPYVATIISPYTH